MLVLSARRTLPALVVVFGAAAARMLGEVVDAGENGCTIKSTVTVPVESEKAYAAMETGKP